MSDLTGGSYGGIQLNRWRYTFGAVEAQGLGPLNDLRWTPEVLAVYGSPESD